ncbi:MAG: type II toxin-antitoxin system HicB family antitoxin [Patescibacteria group bacterium]
MKVLNLPLTIKVFKEGSSKENPFVAYNPELDISSCGKTEEDARNMLKEAVSVLLDGAKEDGTLDQLLEESGLASEKSNFSFSFFTIPVPYTYKTLQKRYA